MGRCFFLDLVSDCWIIFLNWFYLLGQICRFLNMCPNMNIIYDIKNLILSLHHYASLFFRIMDVLSYSFSGLWFHSNCRVRDVCTRPINRHIPGDSRNSFYSVNTWRRLILNSKGNTLVLEEKILIRETSFVDSCFVLFQKQWQEKWH